MPRRPTIRLCFQAEKCLAWGEEEGEEEGEEGEEEGGGRGGKRKGEMSKERRRKKSERDMNTKIMYKKD